jgi:tRNA (mo5U34)-methyltransferase
MDKIEKIEKVSQRNDWFHSIDFGDGVISPGCCTPQYLDFLWKKFKLPDDMSGLRILDIGTYDGWFAFECEKRNAKEVVATDIHPVDCRCFELAHKILGSNVIYKQVSVYDMHPESLGGNFDIVLFLGVYYHLRHLFIALDNLWSITKGFMIFESHVIDDHFILDDGTVVKMEDIDPRLNKVPIYRFYRKNELNNDYSNWFGGNRKAIEFSLLSAGFIPLFLDAWDSRIAFRADRNPKVPREWEIGSYEGTKFIINPDGTWKSLWINPYK